MDHTVIKPWAEFSGESAVVTCVRCTGKAKLKFLLTAVKEKVAFLENLERWIMVRKV